MNLEDESKAVSPVGCTGTGGEFEVDCKKLGVLEYEAVSLKTISTSPCAPLPLLAIDGQRRPQDEIGMPCKQSQTRRLSVKTFWMR